MALSLRFPSVAVSNCHALCCPDFPPRVNTRRLANNLTSLLYPIICRKMYTDSMKKLPRELVAVTISWLIVTIITVALFTANPQCPEQYTQAQIDAEGCIVGANIGAGLLAQFVLIPLTALLLIGWGTRLFGKKSKPSNKR